MSSCASNPPQGCAHYDRNQQLQQSSCNRTWPASVDGRRLRLKVSCHDASEPIGDGFHERTIVDHDRFMARLAPKSGTPPVEWN